MAENIYKKYGKSETIRLEYEILLKLQQELSKERQIYFPRVYGFEENGEESCLLLEYLKGKTLLEISDNKEQIITKEQFLLYMKETAKGLCILHQMRPSILWCDCKPSNLMFDSKGQLKLIDFNHACFLHKNVQRKTYGTRKFAAPEQKTGEILDVRTDIYAYGKTFLSLNPKKSYLQIQKLLKQCCMEQKDKRIQTAAELLYEVDRIS